MGVCCQSSARGGPIGLDFELSSDLVPDDQHEDAGEDQHREDCSDRHSLFSPRNDVGLHTTALEVNPKKCRLLSAKQKKC